jgi:hypothetical protein
LTYEIRNSVAIPNRSEDKVDEYTQSEKKNFLNKLSHLGGIFMHPNSKQEETAKISYKHMQRIEISLYSSKESASTNIDIERCFWFAAYDKNINITNILKVLQFYTEESVGKVVEKSICVKDFEIYFENYNNAKYSKPFLKYKKVTN